MIQDTPLVHNASSGLTSVAPRQLTTVWPGFRDGTSLQINLEVIPGTVVAAGEDVQLRCKVSGIDTSVAEFTWLRDGEVMQMMGGLRGMNQFSTL